MPTIEIRYFTGDVDRIQLSKKQPVSIGRQPTNDVCIDEDGVAMLHCRVAWNKSGYEVAAANLDGVDVNGKIVRHAPLRDGDVIRVGSVDIAFLNGDPAPDEATAQQPATKDIHLKPISEDNIHSIYSLAKPELGIGSLEPAPAAEKVAHFPPHTPQDTGKEKKRNAPVKPKDDLPDDLFSGEIEVDEAPVPVLKRGGAKPTAGKRAEKSDADESARSDDSETRRGRAAKSTKPKRRVRPGEEDPLRSPLVLGLGGGVILLLLIGATFYFMLGRRTSQNLYQSAVDAHTAGQYGQAIQYYKEFLTSYPRHNSADAARLGLAKAQVESLISGSSPDWKEGLAELERFFKDNRERDDYDSYRTAGLEYAERIARSAAQVSKTSASATTRRRELLETARSGQALLKRYGGNDVSAELNAELDKSFREAEAAIFKQETRDTALKQIEAALDGRNAMAALAARDELLARYSDYSGDTQLARLLERTLEVERTLVVSEDVGRGAITEERPDAPPPPLTLLLHARVRSDELSEDRVVVAIAKDCCFGVDTVTGEPRWRRVIGLDTPFFPVEVDASVPALLMFDSVHRELLAVDRLRGTLLWRQPMEEMASAAPLVHEGQIYLPTNGNDLYRIDLETGALTSRLVFSQPIAGAPVLSPTGDEMIVAGEQALAYTLSFRPLECRRVTYLGHRAGAIQAPLVSMGSLILVAENDRAESCRLRIFNTGNSEQPLIQIAEERVEGHVRDEPILRGRQLFVATDRHVILAFSVSDDPNQTPIVSVARFALQQPHDGPLYLSAGPDGHLWLASSALRKFQLQTEGFQLDPNAAAVGYTSQPLQLVGGSLYLGRRLPYSSATILTQFDRDAMTSQWRLEVGASVLAAQSAGADAAVCVNENGHLFRISAAELERGGFRWTPSASLNIPDTLTEPLRAASLEDGRIAVYAGGETPQLWVVNAAGQIESGAQPAKPLQADPVAIAAGLVLPLAGRLTLAPLGPSRTPADDYLAPIEGQPADWRWISLAPLDETQLLALDSVGNVRKIQFRTAPAATLTQVASVQVGAAVDVPAAYHNGRLIVASADGRLSALDGATLETVAQTQLEAPASSPLWTVDDRLVLETGAAMLTSLSLGSELSPLWSIPLEGARLAGQPVLTGGGLYVPLTTGDVLKIDPDSGEVVERVALGQPLNAGLAQIGNALVAFSIDGSLHPVVVLASGN